MQPPTQLDILLIDNFDSFTFNLYQSFSILGRTPTVIRNDQLKPTQFKSLSINALVISPGPGHPNSDSGISRDAIRYFAGKVPVLGVCMGLECLVDLYGGEISYAGEIMHGKLSLIQHDARGIFKNIPQLFKSTRYHSLAASHSSLPADLMISAIASNSGVIMAVRHRKYVLEAVQYHPESVLSEYGDDLLRNFLSYKGATWEENPHSAVLDSSLPPFSAIPQQVPEKVPSILEKIYANRLSDVQLAKSTPGTTPADLATLLSMHIAPPLISFVDRLKSHHTPALMAEIKRASPSKGPIALNASAPAQALLYAISGASVISVLTEPVFFKGLLSDLAATRAAVSHLPDRPAILRKDFILDEYQIAEARVNGADTVLLIVAMLPPLRLRALYAYSLSLGMEPLVEVNNAAEMQTAFDLGAKVIGVNNRNLHNFNVDMNTTSRLADMVKDRDVILCALSGISTRADVQMYTDQGVRAVLVGESLMKATNTRQFIAELLDIPTTEPSAPPPATPLVKICGIRTKEEAVACADAGADMLGLVFVKSSKRCVSLATAQDIASAVRSHRSVPPPSQSADITKPWFAFHAAQFPLHRPVLVGVFQNQSLDEILEAVNSVRLDLVQLHGNEPVEWARFIPVPVIKAFHVDSGISSPEALTGLTRPGYHHFLLLDTLRTADPQGLSGGSGQVFDWDIAQKAVVAGEIAAIPAEDDGDGDDPRSEDDDGNPPLPIILAGGLSPDNVSAAVQKVRPWAVDVSGGVENEDGTAKDMVLVLRFVKEVKDFPEHVVEK